MVERSERLYSIDWLRGLVMVLMALDHCRDYYGHFNVDPLDLDTTTPVLFMTRWITHFCAPIFVFLAGAAVWLYGSRGRSVGEVSRFLWTRGLWLIFLDFTVIYYGWTQSFTLGMWFLQVVAAIGFGMVALAGLVYLPRAVIAFVALAIVAGHNLFDSVSAAELSVGWLWTLAVEGSLAPRDRPVVLGRRRPGAVGGVPARAVGGGHRAGIRRGTGVRARARRPPPDPVALGARGDGRVRDAARDRPLRRPWAVGCAGRPRDDGVVVLELPEVPAVVALSHDDAGTRPWCCSRCSTASQVGWEGRS